MNNNKITATTQQIKNTITIQQQATQQVQQQQVSTRPQTRSSFNWLLYKLVPGCRRDKHVAITRLGRSQNQSDYPPRNGQSIDRK